MIRLFSCTQSSANFDRFLSDNKLNVASAWGETEVSFAHIIDTLQRDDAIYEGADHDYIYVSWSGSSDKWLRQQILKVRKRDVDFMLLKEAVEQNAHRKAKRLWSSELTQIAASPTAIQYEVWRARLHLSVELPP